MDDFIHTITSTADYVKAKLRSNKDMMISFDEWNIWSIEGEPWQNYFNDSSHLFEEAPPILEQKYTFLDALTFGGLMCSLLNHCDRVQMASLAQLVNVIAPILTQNGGEAIRQTIFWPFKMVSQYARGQSLRYFAKLRHVSTVHGEAQVIQSAAVYNDDNKQIAFFALNIDEVNSVNIRFIFDDFGHVSVSRHTALYGHELDATNDFSNPNRVIPKEIEVQDQQNDHIMLSLPPLSWNMVLFDLDN